MITIIDRTIEYGFRCFIDDYTVAIGCINDIAYEYYRFMNFAL